MLYKAFRSVEKHMPVPLGVLCAYELAALLSYPLVRQGVISKPLPTVSKVCNRNKWVFGLLTGYLTAHVWLYETNG